MRAMPVKPNMRCLPSILQNGNKKNIRNILLPFPFPFPSRPLICLSLETGRGIWAGVYIRLPSINYKLSHPHSLQQPSHILQLYTLYPAIAHRIPLYAPPGTPTRELASTHAVDIQIIVLVRVLCRAPGLVTAYGY